MGWNNGIMCVNKGLNLGIQGYNLEGCEEGQDDSDLFLCCLLAFGRFGWLDICRSTYFNLNYLLSISIHLFKQFILSTCNAHSI